VGMAAVELGHARLVRQIAATMRALGEEAEAERLWLQAALLEGRNRGADERLATLSDAEKNALLPLVVDGLRRRGRYGRAGELARLIPDPCRRLAALLLLVRAMAGIAPSGEGTLASLLVT